MVARVTEPQFKLVVLNRLSMTNLIEDVDTTFELEVVDRYLIFRREGDEETIRGLWFHSLEEHARMGALLEKVQADAAREAAAPPPAPPAPAASHYEGAAQLLTGLAIGGAGGTPSRGGGASPGLLSPALFSPSSVVPPPAPSLDLETFKGVLRDLVEDDAFITELHIRYQDKLRS